MLSAPEVSEAIVTEKLAQTLILETYCSCQTPGSEESTGFMAKNSLPFQTFPRLADHGGYVWECYYL